MCIFTPDVIQQIMGNATLHLVSVLHINVMRKVYDLALLFNMRTQDGPKKM